MSDDRPQNPDICLIDPEHLLDTTHSSIYAQRTPAQRKYFALYALRQSYYHLMAWGKTLYDENGDALPLVEKKYFRGLVEKGPGVIHAHVSVIIRAVLREGVKVQAAWIKDIPLEDFDPVQGLPKLVRDHLAWRTSEMHHVLLRLEASAFPRQTGEEAKADPSTRQQKEKTGIERAKDAVPKKSSWLRHFCGFCLIAVMMIVAILVVNTYGEGSSFPLKMQSTSVFLTYYLAACLIIICIYFGRNLIRGTIRKIWPLP